ncbi:MAG: hypothetical protein ACREBE_13250, partial [bacterium]
AQASGTVASPAQSAASTEPQLTIGPTAGPLSADQQRLLGALPVLAGGAASACSGWSTPPGGVDVLSPSGYGGSMARLRCSGPDGGNPTEYALYLTKEAMKADYDSIMATAGVPGGGACVSAIPANAAWNFPDFPSSGDLGCFERDGHVQYVWTQNDLRVLAQWLAPDNPTGRAFWQAWTTTPNAAEAALRANLPDTVDDVEPCIRAADVYYATALAIIACRQVKPLNAVYYAQFASAEGFPNDPMTLMFDQIMTSGGWPDDTTTGCYDGTPTYGRYTWGFNTDGTIGDTEGYIGCFERTDTTAAMAQFVWTFDRTAVMGLWNAPDLSTGIDFFDTWIGEVR